MIFRVGTLIHDDRAPAQPQRVCFKRVWNGLAGLALRVPAVDCRDHLEHNDLKQVGPPGNGKSPDFSG